MLFKLMGNRLTRYIIFFAVSCGIGIILYMKSYKYLFVLGDNFDVIGTLIVALLISLIVFLFIFTISHLVVMLFENEMKKNILISSLVSVIVLLIAADITIDRYKVRFEAYELDQKKYYNVNRRTLRENYAEIHCQNVLLLKSVNGVVFNGSPSPLGKGVGFDPKKHIYFLVSPGQYTVTFEIEGYRVEKSNKYASDMVSWNDTLDLSFDVKGGKSYYIKCKDPAGYEKKVLPSDFVWLSEK